MANLKLVPELYCSDIHITKQFYSQVFGFEIKYERPDEHFVYFTLEGVDIMVEGLKGEDRRWLTEAMSRPFGRGINFQWDVSEIDLLYKRVLEIAPENIYLEMETKQYQCGNAVAEQKQFIVQDPDGYLFRFCLDPDNL